MLFGLIELKSWADRHDSALSSEITSSNYVIRDAYLSTNKLPETIYDFIIFTPGEKDPLTIFLEKKELTYQKTGEKTYALCGKFKTNTGVWTDREEKLYSPGPNDAWGYDYHMRYTYHKRGMYCFHETVAFQEP